MRTKPKIGVERVEHLEQGGTSWNKVEQKNFISILIFNIVPDVPCVLHQNRYWLYGSVNYFFIGLGGDGCRARKSPGGSGASSLSKGIRSRAFAIDHSSEAGLYEN